MPCEVKDEFQKYVIYLNEMYANDDIPTIAATELKDFQSHMVVAKIKNRWSRARIVKFFEDEVELEDYDTGRNDVIKVDRQLIKVPQEGEIFRPAFACRVMFENILDPEIGPAETIKICITHAIQFGINIALVQIEENDSEDSDISDKGEKDKKEETSDLPKDLPVAPPTPSPRQHVDERLYKDMIQSKAMNSGPNKKLLCLDGSDFEQGKLSVCEGSQENIDFFNTLVDRISEYVTANPSGFGYIPK